MSITDELRKYTEAEEARKISLSVQSNLNRLMECVVDPKIRNNAQAGLQTAYFTADELEFGEGKVESIFAAEGIKGLLDDLGYKTTGGTKGIYVSW